MFFLSQRIFSGKRGGALVSWSIRRRHAYLGIWTLSTDGLSASLRGPPYTDPLFPWDFGAGFRTGLSLSASWVWYRLGNGRRTATEL